MSIVGQNFRDAAQTGIDASAQRLASLVQARVRLDPARLSEFCRRNHISRLSLFGSVLRDDFSPESDVDVLVQFEPSHTPAWEFFGMQAELAALFGRRVDLNTPGFVSRYFRDQVQAEAYTLYEWDVDLDIVWNVVVGNLPDLVAWLDSLLNPPPGA